MGGVYQANPDKPTRGHLPAESVGFLAYEHPYDIQFKPCWGWTKNITLLDDHRLFKRFPQFRLWTKADHLAESAFARRAADWLESGHQVLAADALRTYGNHGSLVSGVVRNHFPVEVQDTLRYLAQRASRERNRAWVHWKAAGKRGMLPEV